MINTNAIPQFAMADDTVKLSLSTMMLLSLAFYAIETDLETQYDGKYRLQEMHIDPQDDLPLTISLYNAEVSDDEGITVYGNLHGYE